jgi:uncharacterized protein (TIGR03083 family)
VARASGIGAITVNLREAKIEVMNGHRLDYESHRAAFERECGLIVDAIVDALELPVPTCPQWRVSDLAEHLVDVFTFWNSQLEAASPGAQVASRSQGATAGAEVVDRLEGARTALQLALAAHDPEDPCWNWAGEDLTADWVCRRMALESAVHRYDLELSVSSPTPIDRDLAVDGIDEWIGVHLATDVPETPGISLGGVLCLACSDDSAAWTVEVVAGRLRWREGRGPADAVLVGSASDLYLFGWNRRPLEVLELTGNRDVAAAWSSLTV